MALNASDAQVPSATTVAAAAGHDAGIMTTMSSSMMNLPENRFELELEFLQALASPAYLHFLATSRDTEETIEATTTTSGSRLTAGSSSSSSSSSSSTYLQNAQFQQFLLYLRDTYSQPPYVRFLPYPHALYFLNVLIEQPNVIKEWTLPEFRNFCHQQQFLAWQHRHSVCYGVGSVDDQDSNTAVPNPDSHNGLPSASAADAESEVEDESESAQNATAVTSGIITE
jgi:mediator of RNA polymerase II transcription subunit 31